jgi:hypothetical protein
MTNRRIFGLTDALLSLYPEAEWSLSGDNYSGLSWLSSDIDQPSEDELYLEVSRLQAEYDILDYQRLRSAEYPDFRDYLDGVVKGDQAQIDSYIAACLAVKQKYPKPE